MKAAHRGYNFEIPAGLSDPEIERFKQATRRERTAAYDAEERSRRRKPTLNSLRISELYGIAMHRWPDPNSDFAIPEDAAGTALVEAMISHMRGRPGDNWGAIFGFCRDHCTWFDLDSIDLAAPIRPMSADALGAAIQLTPDERQKLSIHTIGAVGVSRAQRRKNRKESNRLREQARREANGAKPRSKSLARLKTWEQEGMSRAKWFRVRKGMRAVLVRQLREHIANGLETKT